MVSAQQLVISNTLKVVHIRNKCLSTGETRTRSTAVSFQKTRLTQGDEKAISLAEQMKQNKTSEEERFALATASRHSHEQAYWD